MLRPKTTANKISGSSVEYGVAIFREGTSEAVADGFFTHVFVDRTTGKPVRIPEGIREALEKIFAPPPLPVGEGGSRLAQPAGG